jgi:hypothetical protein
MDPKILEKNTMLHIKYPGRLVQKKIKNYDLSKVLYAVFYTFTLKTTKTDHSTKRLITSRECLSFATFFFQLKDAEKGVMKNDQ